MKTINGILLASIKTINGIPIASVKTWNGITIPIAGFALFGGGSASIVTAYTDKYTYSGDTVADGTALGLERSGLAAAGNSTVGIFGAGQYNLASNDYNTNYTDKYTYSDNSRIPGTTLATPRQLPSATGNATVGIFGGGWPDTTYTDKYTYSGDSRAAGTALGMARYGMGATGNSTVGIFSGGNHGGPFTTNYTDRYTYSDNSRIVGTVLTLAKTLVSAAGNTTVGIFGSAFAYVDPNSCVWDEGLEDYVCDPPVEYDTDKYTYSGDTVAPSALLTSPRIRMAAAGNTTVGIFGGGDGPTNYTDKYTYSGDTMAAGHVLNMARTGMAAASSSPGGF